MNKCVHVKQRINDTLVQCIVCEKLFTVGVKKRRRPEREASSPEGYQKMDYLTEKYGVNKNTIHRWAKDGFVTKFERYFYYEKDVARCVEHIGEHGRADFHERAKNVLKMGGRVTPHRSSPEMRYYQNTIY